MKNILFIFLLSKNSFAADRNEIANNVRMINNRGLQFITELSPDALSGLVKKSTSNIIGLTTLLGAGIATKKEPLLKQTCVGLISGIASQKIIQWYYQREINQYEEAKNNFLQGIENNQEKNFLKTYLSALEKTFAVGYFIRVHDV